MARTHLPLISSHHLISINCRLLSQGQAQLWLLISCWRWCKEGWHRHCLPDMEKAPLIVLVITILMSMVMWQNWHHFHQTAFRMTHWLTCSHMISVTTSDTFTYFSLIWLITLHVPKPHESFWLRPMTRCLLIIPYDIITDVTMTHTDSYMLISPTSSWLIRTPTTSYVCSTQTFDIRI